MRKWTKQSAEEYIKKCKGKGFDILECKRFLKKS